MIIGLFHGRLRLVDLSGGGTYIVQKSQRSVPLDGMTPVRGFSLDFTVPNQLVEAETGVSELSQSSLAKAITG